MVHSDHFILAVAVLVQLGPFKSIAMREDAFFGQRQSILHAVKSTRINLVNGAICSFDER